MYKQFFTSKNPNITMLANKNLLFETHLQFIGVVRPKSQAQKNGAPCI